MRRIAIIVALATGLLVIPASAFATNWGNYQLAYGSCCSGATLDGTRAYISVSSVSPDSNNCLIHSSVVAETNGSKQLEAGDVLCGSNANIDGTCSLSNNFVKFVERYNGSSYVCYPHGTASTGSSYLITVDDSAGNGTFWSYIAGTLYEGQSGYDNSVTIYEWGEYTGSSCSGWSDSTSFSTWQRYNYSGNSWTTVGSATNGTTGCWTTGSLSSGSFSISH